MQTPNIHMNIQFPRKKSRSHHTTKKEKFLQQLMLRKLSSHMKGLELDHYVIPYTKISSISKVNSRPSCWKTIVERASNTGGKTGELFLEFRNVFGNSTLVTRQTKTNKKDYINFFKKLHKHQKKLTHTHTYTHKS